MANEKLKNNIIEPYLERNVCKMGRVLETTNDSITLVYLERDVYASDQTLNEIYSNVYDLINNNKQIDDIDNFVKSNNLKPRKVTLEKMDESVSGLGSSRQIVRWAFNASTQIGEPTFFDLEDKYVITVLSSVLEDEIKPLSAVQNDIKLVLKNRQKANTISDKVKNMNVLDLSDLAMQFKTEVKSIEGLIMDSDVFGDAGYNPEVVGLFLGSKTGELSAPYVTKKWSDYI